MLQVPLHWMQQAFKRGQEFAGGAGSFCINGNSAAPNTWPSHNSQWESRFKREGERLWHRLCPMTQLQGSGSPQCVDSVTARVEPWRIGCASLPIVLTPVNCGASYQRAFPLGYLTLNWISELLEGYGEGSRLCVRLHYTTGATKLGSLTLHWLLKL